MCLVNIALSVLENCVYKVKLADGFVADQGEKRFDSLFSHLVLILFHVSEKAGSRDNVMHGIKADNGAVLRNAKLNSLCSKIDQLSGSVGVGNNGMDIGIL